MSVIDLNFWDIVKSHTWLDSTTLYLLKRDEMFAIVITSADDMILETYTTFDDRSASIKYNDWKAKLMKSGHREWHSELQ